MSVLAGQCRTNDATILLNVSVMWCFAQWAVNNWHASTNPIPRCLSGSSTMEGPVPTLAGYRPVTHNMVNYHVILLISTTDLCCHDICGCPGTNLAPIHQQQSWWIDCALASRKGSYHATCFPLGTYLCVRWIMFNKRNAQYVHNVRNTSL